ncbi:MAG: hypothetical protein WAX85_03165 [Minisyncoccia bacterium]
MAKNKPYGDGARKGEVSRRSQLINPKNKRHVKRNRDDGKFMDVKFDEKKFKGVQKEK